MFCKNTNDQFGYFHLILNLSTWTLIFDKDLVDGAPKTLKENVAKEEAEGMKTKLAEAGATVELA